MTEQTVTRTLPTHERRLDNGLTVIVREDRSAPVVAVVTHVKAGYFDEPDSLVGISHVLEHMYFKGTERRGPGDMARETKGAGGYLNAGTIYDHTSYYTVLPSSSLEQALDIQADALQQSTIDEAELERELLVITQEAKRKLDNPGAVAQETLFETMFDTHRIRRWRIGTEDVLRGFRRADVWQYYTNLYRAANTVLVIAGDVEAERAFALAEQHYGAMSAGESIRDAGPTEPARREFRYRELDGDIAQTHVEWGWRSPGALHEDTPALDVLTIALGSGRASRLYRNVRDAGHAAAISAWNYTPGDIGVFGISAELDPADLEDALRATAAVLRNASDEGFTADEAERARNILEARVLRRLETVEGQANLIADWQALGDWRLADDYLERALGVTAEQLQDVARRYLDPEALTLLVYRPRAAPAFAADAAAARGRIFDETALRTVAARQQGAAQPHSAEPTSASTGARGATPTARSPIRVEDGVHIYGAEEGGARIIIKPRRSAPLVSLALYCRGGLLSEDAATAGLTGLMARTSVKGTRTRSGARLAEESESLGASISPGAGLDTIDWSMSAPARHFERGLELLLDAALEPAFRPEDAERERKVTLSNLEHLRDDMHQYPMQLALASGFGGHPYGFELSLLEESIRNADPGALADWHARHVLHGAPHLFVTGDIADPDRAAAVIAGQLAGRLGAPAHGHMAPPSWPAEPAQRVEQRDKAQTALVLAFPGPPRNHPDVYPLQLLSAAISGLGGRLFEELRSRRSLAYSVSAAPLPRWQGGVFVAYIGTSPEREMEAREELLRELVRTTRDELDEDELERARCYMIGSWQIRQQTNSRQLADLAVALLLGEGLAELREYVPRLEAITAEQVRAAAARWIRPDRLVEAVVRGKS